MVVLRPFTSAAQGAQAPRLSFIRIPQGTNQLTHASGARLYGSPYLLVYARPSKHEHILMIVPTPLDITQHSRSIIAFDGLYCPVWPDDANSIAGLSVKYRLNIRVIIDIAKPGLV